MMLTHNNWFSWGYRDNGRFFTNYEHYGTKLLSFKNALIFNAEKTMEQYPNHVFDIMLSGGVDCEVMLRTYLELGQRVTATVFRYENDYNKYDVDFAIAICQKLKQKLKIIDFSLKDFFAKDALDVYRLAKSSHARTLPQLKFLDYVDNIPIYASSDIRWVRPNSNYDINCSWVMEDFEYEVAWDRYVSAINRPAIMQWYKYTPEIVAGWMHSKWFKRLVHNMIPGKLGLNSTKILGYQEVYPDLEPRVKQTGFEVTDHLVHPFQNSLLEDLSEYPAKWFAFKGRRYSQYTSMGINEFYRKLTGTNYTRREFND